MVLSISFGSIFEKYFSPKPIDNAILSMVYCCQMDDVQTLLADLKAMGWRNTSIADAIGVTVNAVEKWQAADRNIRPSHLILLNQLTKKKPPKRKRRVINNRRKGVSS
jgi:hypothetical protein